MKIGIESQRIFRNRKHGMDVVAIELVRQLQKIDQLNQFVLFAKDGPDRNCISETDNFKIEILRGFTYGDWEQISLPAALKKMKPDLIHCTANTAPLNCPVPLILTLHDVMFLRETDFSGSAYQNFGNLYRKYIVPHVVRKANTIITVSEAEKKIIQKACHADPSKITVIHNAVDERFARERDPQELKEFREKYKLPPRFILHLGNTAPKKNTARLVEAYALYCGYVNESLPLVIADYSEHLVQMKLRGMGRMELKERIILPGYIPASEMHLLYACASLFIYPSLQESFGLPLLESMCSGTPVIASDLPALREVGEEAPVFVNPEDAHAIAQKIVTFLSDDAMRKDHISRGIERAKQFTWRKSAEKLLNVYSSSV